MSKSSKWSPSSSPSTPMTSIVPFKRPPSPSILASLNKRRVRGKVKVMDEDEYVDKVSEIIERDFFPELEKLEAQKEFIEAKERNDVQAILRLKERFSTGSLKHQGRLDTPDTFETPLEKRREEPEEEQIETPREKEEEDIKEETKKDEEKKMSLDQFLAKHTSEDNESFDNIMDESKKKFMLTHSWMFKEDEAKSIEMKSDQLVLPSIEHQQAMSDQDTGKSKTLDGWTYKNVNTVFYTPSGVELSPEEAMERAKKERSIVAENTRFKRNPWKVDLEKTNLQATVINKKEKEVGRVGVDGKELTRADTPSVNGFKFLRMTPSPMPGAMGESPLMTWGEVDSTPFRLEGCDTPLPMNTSGGPSFSIQGVPKRDQILYDLAEKNSKFYRDKKGKAIQKARSNIRTPKLSLSERVATMSPAAQRLATNKLGIRLGTDKALKAAYTPSPARSTKSSRTPSSVRSAISSSIRAKGSATPKTPMTYSADSSTSLTDNLLNLPSTSNSGSSSAAERMRASDFL